MIQMCGARLALMAASIARVVAARAGGVVVEGEHDVVDAESASCSKRRLLTEVPPSAATLSDRRALAGCGRP